MFWVGFLLEKYRLKFRRDLMFYNPTFKYALEFITYPPKF